jgi:hypothetical protein
MSATNSERLIASQEKYFAGSYAQFLEFGGPCVYFHEECLKAGENAFLSTRHIESLYATLTAWGMHRLGTKAKLVDWEAFRKSIEECGRAVDHLRQTKLLEVSEPDYNDILKELALAYRKLRVSISDATVVANSKALFHLLPNLIPPIDRQYTIRFVRYSPTQWKRRGKFTMIMLPGDAEGQFDLFRSVCTEIKRLADQVQRSILDREYQEHGVTAPKAIDNAIVNYVRIESKGTIEPE